MYSHLGQNEQLSTLGQSSCCDLISCGSGQGMMSPSADPKSTTAQCRAHRQESFPPRCCNLSYSIFLSSFSNTHDFFFHFLARNSNKNNFISPLVTNIYSIYSFVLLILPPCCSFYYLFNCLNQNILYFFFFFSQNG